MAVGDIIDIGGRAFMEVAANNVGGEETGKSYAMVVTDAALGELDDAAWDGISTSPSIISLLKKIALNTAP